MNTRTMTMIAGLAVALAPAAAMAQQDSNQRRYDNQRDSQRTTQQHSDYQSGHANAKHDKANGKLGQLSGLWRVTLTRYDANGQESTDYSDLDGDANSGYDGYNRDVDDLSPDRQRQDRDDWRNDNDANDRDNKNRDNKSRENKNRDNKRNWDDSDKNQRDNANRNNPNRNDRDNMTRKDRDARHSGDHSTMQVSGIAERSWALDGTVLVERYTYGRTNAGQSMSDLPLNDLSQSASANSRRGDARTDRRGDWDRDNDRLRDRDMDNPNLEEDGTPMIRDMSEDTWQDTEVQPNESDASSPLIEDMSTNPNDIDNDRRANRDRNSQNRNNPNARRDRDRDAAELERWAERPAQLGEQQNAGRQGLALWSYDAQTDKVSVVWADDTGNQIRMDEGKLGANKKIELDGTMKEKDGECKTRTVIDLSSPERQTLVMYKTDSKTGKEQKAFQMVYEKISASGRAISRVAD